MFQKWDSPGFWLQCDEYGRVMELLHEAEELPFTIMQGALLRDYCDPGSRDKMDQFFIRVMENGAVYNYELCLAGNDAVIVLNCCGICRHGSVLVMGTEVPANMNKIYEEILLINNEQLNTIRQLSKQVFLLKDKITDIRQKHIRHYERILALTAKTNVPGKD